MHADGRRTEGSGDVTGPQDMTELRSGNSDRVPRPKARDSRTDEETADERGRADIARLPLNHDLAA